MFLRRLERKTAKSKSMMNTLPTHDVTTEKGLDAFLDEILGFVDDEETETPESTMGADGEN